MWYFYFWYAVAAGFVIGLVIGFGRELRDAIREYRRARAWAASRSSSPP